MQVAGYFYYYGHYYAGLCIDQLHPEDRAEYRAMLSKILIKHQEPNGCWWDYTLYNYHKEYGTAFALLLSVTSAMPCMSKAEGKKMLKQIRKNIAESPNPVFTKPVTKCILREVSRYLRTTDCITQKGFDRSVTFALGKCIEEPKK